MLKLKVILGLVLLVLGFFFGTPSSELTLRRSWPAITSVEIGTLTADDASFWLLWARGSYPRDCDGEQQVVITRYPDNVDIQLYRNTPSTVSCSEEEKQFETELKLDSELSSPYLIINERVWELTYPPSTELGGGSVPSLHELSLFPVHIDEAILRVGDAADQDQLIVRGSQAVGCDLPEIYALRHTSTGFQVGVYNALAAETVCPQVLLPVDGTIRLPATDPLTVTLFSVNTYQIEAIEEQKVSESDKVLTHIFRVDVKVMESQPIQITLDVEGEHPDGCEYPVLVSQTRRGNSIDIEVYRNVPADVVCPMILKPYRDMISVEGTFESGEYTINVNSHSQAVNI